VTSASRVTESDAVRIAQEECSRLGIEWRDPYPVKKGWRRWRVYMPSDVKGGNATILVSRTTGVVRVRYYDR
jgi:hypothetical protein